MAYTITRISYTTIVHVTNESPTPAAAHSKTTAHDGTFQNMRRPNAAAASAKSVGSLIDDVHTGSKRAAARIPTTAAFMATSAARKLVTLLSLFQKGRMAMTRREGRQEYGGEGE